MVAFYKPHLFQSALKGPFGKEFTPVHITHRLSEELSPDLLVPVIALIQFICYCRLNSILIRFTQIVKNGISFFYPPSRNLL